MQPVNIIELLQANLQQQEYCYPDTIVAGLVDTGDPAQHLRQRRVIASIVDRNLKPNAQADSLKDKIRDIAVGIGAIGIFSKIQWQGLADGIVKQ